MDCPFLLTRRPDAVDTESERPFARAGAARATREGVMQVRTKRVLIPAAFATLLAVLPAGLAEAQTGPRVGIGFGTPNAVFIVRPSIFDLKLGYDFTEDNEFVFLSGDIRFVSQRHLGHYVHLSLGLGAYAKFYADDLEGGGRIPVALSVLLLDNFLEFFVEVSPGIDFYPRAAISDDPLQAWVGFTLLIDMP